jgi:hypothetical protein
VEDCSTVIFSSDLLLLSITSRCLRLFAAFIELRLALPSSSPTPPSRPHHCPTQPTLPRNPSQLPPRSHGRHHRVHVAPLAVRALLTPPVRPRCSAIGTGKGAGLKAPAGADRAKISGEGERGGRVAGENRWGHDVVLVGEVIGTKMTDDVRNQRRAGHKVVGTKLLHDTREKCIANHLLITPLSGILTAKFRSILNINKNVQK